MSKSKLVLIIEQLSTKECEIIKNSIESPLLDGKKHHTLIFNEYFKNRKKKFELKRADLRKKLFQNTISDAQLRLYMSELFKIISACIVMLHSKNDINYQDNVLISRFKHSDEYKLFDSQFTGGLKRLKNHPFRNAEYLELKYDIGFQEYTHISSSNRTRDLNIQELLDDVDLIFISKKLRQACFAVAHQSVYGQEYDYGLLSQILTHIEEDENLLKHPSVRLYYSAYKMLHAPKEATFFNQFISDIDELKHLFPDTELQGVYRFAINQCIRLINRGQIEYGTIALDLYDEALTSKYLLVDGYLSRFTFKNIAAIAVKIGEFERAEKFSKEYFSSLRKEERNSALNLNQALISYHLKDFDTALRSLQEVDFKDHLFNLAAKVIQMKIYFESEEFDLLDSHLDAMQMYILRKKVIGYHKTNYKNIIKLTRKLLKIKPGDTTAIKILRSEIENAEVLTEKKWLLNQL
jgi:hypothetical protein